MSDHAALAEQLRWEAANLRAMRLWLIEQQDLVAAANRIEAVAEDMFPRCSWIRRVGLLLSKRTARVLATPESGPDHSHLYRR